MLSELRVISEKIKDGIRKINTGDGAIPHVPPITAKTIGEFMKSPRGLALIFWALNQGWGNYFEADEFEWRQNKPRDHLNGSFVLDCHTHYFEKIGMHPAEQYQQGARQNWWFFPEAYNFAAEGSTIGEPKLKNIKNIHGADKYRDFMEDTYFTLNKRFAFFVTPAPFEAPDDVMMDGENDTASYEHMKQLCNRINRSAGKVICHPYGVISYNSNATTFPAISDNISRLWKLYPHDDWANGPGEQWLKENLSGTLRQLNSQRQKHTIAIHWWGDGAPEENDLGEIADKYTNVNFVVYHGCYPNHDRLGVLINKPGRINIFTEIGGVFANQICGGDGGDSLSGKGGPSAAKAMIEELRGKISSGVGVNDAKLLWGTDAIWHGSSIWQIEAFKRLKLKDTSETQDIAFKRKVFGHNAKLAFSITSSTNRYD